MCWGSNKKDLVFLNEFKPLSLTEYLPSVLRTFGLEVVHPCLRSLGNVESRRQCLTGGGGRRCGKGCEALLQRSWYLPIFRAS